MYFHFYVSRNFDSLVNASSSDTSCDTSCVLRNGLEFEESSVYHRGVRGGSGVS
jgi:hypothetical protein